MENLLLNVLLSNTSIIILVSVLWYLIGLILALVTIYVIDSKITLMGLFIALLIGILGPLYILLHLMLKYELFDDIVICKRKGKS